MSDEPEPLPPLGGLAMRALAAERARPDADAGMHERVLARVVASVAVGAAVTGAAATAHGAGSAGAATGSAGAATGSAATGAVTGTAATAAGVTAKTLPWIIAAFVVGGGVGAAVHAAVTSSSPVAAPPTVAVPAPPAATLGSSGASTASAAPTELSPLPAVSVGALPSAPALGTTSAAHVVPSASAAPPSGSDVDLAAERSLVDRARTALGRGQSSDALAALDAHAARFPHGRLVEEREALAVDALARSGRMDLAQARAARFRAAYPNSVFRGAVDAALVPR